MIRGPLKAFLGGTVDPAALLFGLGEYIRQQTAIKKKRSEICRDIPGCDLPSGYDLRGSAAEPRVAGS